MAVPGERIIADVTSQVILEWGGPKSKMTTVLMKGEIWPQRQMDREHREREGRGFFVRMPVQDKGWGRLSAVSSRHQKESTCQHLVLKLLGAQHRERIDFVEATQVGYLFQQP